MGKLKEKINTWIFDLDNTLYSADSGIFQQVHVLMGKYICDHLNIDINKAKKIQKKYYKEHGTTLRGLMDNHGIDPDHFLSKVHKLDYSIVGPNSKLNLQLANLPGRKIVYTNANKEHADNVLKKLKLTDMFDEIFDIKLANYAPKPDLIPYKDFVAKYAINPHKAIMFDDIAKNLVPAKNVGFISVWIDAGYENFSDDVKSSKKFLDFQTKNLADFLEEINEGKI